MQNAQSPRHRRKQTSTLEVDSGNAHHGASADVYLQRSQSPAAHRDADTSKERRQWFLERWGRRYSSFLVRLGVLPKSLHRRRVLGRLVMVFMLLLIPLVGYYQKLLVPPSANRGFGGVRSILLLMGGANGRNAKFTTGPTIVFSWRAVGVKKSLVTPAKTPPLREPMQPDYDDLEMNSLHLTADFVRIISPFDYHNLHYERREYLEAIDDVEVTENYEHTGELSYPRECQRNNWGWTPKPACNNMHETSVNFDPSSNMQQSYDLKYLSHGYYRDTWLVEPHRRDLLDREFILKTLRLIEDHDFDYYNMRKVEKEAIIMERLTKSSIIVDIYGHCGTSIIGEAMPKEVTMSIVPGVDVDDYDRGHIKQAELDEMQEIDVHPMNNLTIKEKVDLALLMAESLAELHNFEGGLIIHGDVHPDQWLKSIDGSIKLNDFNNGHIMEWSLENETYCDYWSNYGGSYKAPEEFIEESYSNEGVDTWALGHGIFGLLTGLFPYYRTFSHTAIRELVMQGRKPFVDDRYRTRSMVEGRLVEIMEQCWEFYAADRPSMYEAVVHIRETKRLFEEEEGAEMDQFKPKLQILKSAETGIVDHNKARITYGKSKVRQTKEQGTLGAHTETGEEVLKRITARRGNTIKLPGLE